MTSLGIDQDLTYHSGGPYVFKIRGQLCHRIGSLLPARESDAPCFAQLWVIDPNQAMIDRRARNPHLSHRILLMISHIMRRSPYAAVYQSAFQILRKNQHNEDFYVTLVFDKQEDKRRYNLPTAADEIAAVIPMQPGKQKYNLSTAPD